MAKFVGGLPPFVGTRDDLTIYFMKGEYIVRTKSSLTGKRVKRDPAFARTMENAGRLKKASRIASLIYQQIPADSRAYKQYREIVGNAMGLLKNGFDDEYVLIALEVAYLTRYLPDFSVPLDPENQEDAVKKGRISTNFKTLPAVAETQIILWTLVTTVYSQKLLHTLSPNKSKAIYTGTSLLYNFTDPG